MKAIVATEAGWGIGRDGDLLIHLPGDLKFFKEQTMGKVLIMGRKTLESLPGGKPLPGRTTIVLTGNEGYVPPHPEYLEGGSSEPMDRKLILVHSFDELMLQVLALETTDGIDAEEDVMVAGGESIYRMFLPYCNEFIVTRIDRSIPADKFFPNMDEFVAAGQMKVAWESEIQTDEKSGVTYRFVRYERA